MMNFSANMLGLDNAATPLGLKAMQELQELNQQKDTASNAMIMFLVLNTAGITLIPTSVIAIRQTIALEQGLTGFNAADIFLPTLIGTFISFVSGMIAVAWFQRINLFKLPVLLFLGGFIGLMTLLYTRLRLLPPEVMSERIALIGSATIFLLIILIILSGVRQKINVYETFVEGAKDGFTTSVQIIPYLIAILVAIAEFRTVGGMDYIVNGIGQIFSRRALDLASPHLRLRRLVLGPFRSDLNPYGLMSADWVAGEILRQADWNCNLIIVTINPLTYVLMPLHTLSRWAYIRCFTRTSTPGT